MNTTPTTVVQDESTNVMHLGYTDAGRLHALCNRRFKVWERTAARDICGQWNDMGCPRCEAKAGDYTTETVLLSKVEG
jgi:hypothetical protein